MLKIKEIIDDEEFERMEVETLRHDDLVSALKGFAERQDDKGGLEKLAKQSAVLLDILSKKNFSPDIRPLLAELTATLKVTNDMLKAPRPMSFTIERNKLGLISRIVTEGDN